MSTCTGPICRLDPDYLTVAALLLGYEVKVSRSLSDSWKHLITSRSDKCTCGDSLERSVQYTDVLAKTAAMLLFSRRPAQTA